MSIKRNPTPFRAQQLIFGYGIFRLILSSGFCALAFIPDAASSIFPNVVPESMQLAAASYLVLCILGMLLSTNESLTRTPITVLLATDILLLMMIMRYCGGVDTGLGNLMLISVGVGGLLLPVQQSLLIAAIATSTTVYTEMLPLSLAERDLTQAAFLGAGFFIETIFLQYVSYRVQSTEQLARAQADTILDLRHLNELIVQRMRTGIIVCTNEGSVRLMNDAAKALLNITEKRPFWLSPEMIDRLKQWQQSPTTPVEAYQTDSEHPLVAINFANLHAATDSDIIVFLEDSGRMQQQAQQLKLASLGRLTASIAHEIRNPLGAISHAAQLLEEAPGLGTADKRLLDIIHNHSMRVNNIIETILQLSRRRPSRLEQIPLAELLTQCLAERELQSQANNDQIKINIVASIDIEIDTNQIKQVLHNLIDNGLRYSEQNIGTRRLKIVSDKLPDTGQFYLDIEDYGPGVPKEQIKNLFEPFYTTESSGTGLGLYIAKELCEANRLLLSYIDNRPGGCFRIIFSHTIAQS